MPSSPAQKWSARSWSGRAGGVATAGVSKAVGPVPAELAAAWLPNCSPAGGAEAVAQAAHKVATHPAQQCNHPPGPARQPHIAQLSPSWGRRPTIRWPQPGQAGPGLLASPTRTPA
eukprot:6559058-Alexandrium_andersonii.AAC.2